MSGAVPTGGNFYAWHGWCKRLLRVPRRSAGAAKDSFDFFAAARNPSYPGQRRLELREGVHGVRDRQLLKDYAETLRRAWYFLINNQGRPVPKDRLAVYVFAVDDDDFDCGSPCFDELLFVKADGDPDKIVSMLALPSRWQEPNEVEALAQCRSAAVHELSHFFNCVVSPWRRIHPSGAVMEPFPKPWAESWLWLDEGMAVATEADFAAAEAAKPDGLPMGQDWLRFALDWVDRPDRALDDRDAFYQAAFFVRYVNRTMSGPGFLNQVWQNARTVWSPVVLDRQTPLTALTREFHRKKKNFCSASNDDVFASGYCFDSYFLNDPKSRAYEPSVFARFKERAITRTWRIGFDAVPGSPSEVYPLAGLACRYFRFLPSDKPGRLSVRVLAEAGHALKAELALAFSKAKTTQYVPKSKRLAYRQKDGNKDILACELKNFSRQTCDHAVLVVTNCAIGVAGPNDPIPSGYSQKIEFSVEARCV